MSYSRWSKNSDWYVYWSAMSGDDRRSQVLSFHHTDGRNHHIKYEVLSEKFEDVMALLGDEDIREYATEFMKDVEEEYPEKGEHQ